MTDRLKRCVEARGEGGERRKEMTYHFWYSPRVEKLELEWCFPGLEFGFLSTLDFPHANTVELNICGEPTRVRYNLCHCTRDAYQNIDDAQYLGEGDLGAVHCRTMMKANEVAERMLELGLVVPGALLRASR